MLGIVLICPCETKNSAIAVNCLLYTSIIQTISPTAIERRYNCSMVFKKEGKLFRGGVEPGNKCLINRKGVDTYLVSDVEITENTWVSWDRGMDLNTGDQVWGSAKGPLKFEKRTSFANELPLSQL